MGKPLEMLGKRLKPPPPKIGAITGEVISVYPLKVRINETIVIKYPKLFCVAGLSFILGDKVIVIASEDNQRFYIVGRLGRYDKL